jgi:hypothetical protein
MSTEFPYWRSAGGVGPSQWIIFERYGSYLADGFKKMGFRDGTLVKSPADLEPPYKLMPEDKDTSNTELLNTGTGTGCQQKDEEAIESLRKTVFKRALAKGLAWWLLE